MQCLSRLAGSCGCLTSIRYMTSLHDIHIPRLSKPQSGPDRTCIVRSTHGLIEHRRPHLLEVGSVLPMVCFPAIPIASMDYLPNLYYPYEIGLVHSSYSKVASRTIYLTENERKRATKRHLRHHASTESRWMHGIMRDYVGRSLLPFAIWSGDGLMSNKFVQFLLAWSKGHII
jgi:hypothetical protein